MSRLPVTVRLTIAFAAVMAVVLAGTGVFVHERLRSGLDSSMRDGLRSRADDVAASVQRAAPGAAGFAGRRLTEVSHSPAQIVDPLGRVIGGTAGTGGGPLVTPAELRRARSETLITGRRDLPKLDDDPLELLATPVDVQGRRMVVIVGASTDTRDEALHRLTAQLVIGGSAALLLATMTALGVARAALRPVASMRRQADAISGTETGRRLVLPRTRDELFRLGETLNAMLARVEQALTRERSFTIDAGHELRMPLTILKTELTLALRHAATRNELEATVRSAGEETDRLVRIVEGLLVLARSDHGRLPVKAGRIDVAALLASVRVRFARRAAVFGRALEASAPRGLCAVADADQIEEALGDVVDNALRHGGGRVELAGRREGAAVEIHVLDEGPGFPEPFLGRAFERFSRADESRSRGGVGLGLSVVASLVEANGGTVGVANRPGGGADVWLTIPAEPSAPGDDAAAEPVREAATGGL